MRFVESSIFPLCAGIAVSNTNFCAIQTRRSSPVGAQRAQSDAFGNRTKDQSSPLNIFKLIHAGGLGAGSCALLVENC